MGFFLKGALVGLLWFSLSSAEVLAEGYKTVFIRGDEPQIEAVKKFFRPAMVGVAELIEPVFGRYKNRPWPGVIISLRGFGDDDGVFVPISNNSAKNGLCGDQKKILGDFIVLKSPESPAVFPQPPGLPPVKTVATPLVPRLVFHIWGPEARLSCERQSRDESVSLFEAEKKGEIARWPGRAKFKLRFFGTDNRYPAPVGGMEKEFFFGLSKYTEYVISVENGRAEFPVDPRWLGGGYMETMTTDVNFIYPESGELMTFPGEFKRCFFSRRHLWMDLHFVHR